MKSLAKGLLLILALETCGVAVAQVPKRSFTFDISLAHDTFKVGSQIAVKVELKNTSDHDLTKMALGGWDVHGELVGFPPIVRDAQGKEPPLTKWGRKAQHRPPLDDHEAALVLNADGPVPIRPGEILNTEIRLNELYDLVPGKYTVQVRYGDDENKGEVKSKTITFTVVP